MISRLDAFVSVRLVAPLLQMGRRHRSRSIPILMYHDISNTAEVNGHPYFEINTSPARFREQMQWLRDGGYSVVTLADALTLWKQDRLAQDRYERHAKPPPKQPVVLTFDDGYRSFHTHAFPVLKEMGFPATVYLATACLEREGGTLEGRECLHWREVEECAGGGIEFGSHTVTHPQLTELTWDLVERELAESKRTIKERLGRDVCSFSYPYAFPQTDRSFVERLKQALRETGYTHAVTTIIGCCTPDDDRLQLPRLPVNSWDDARLFNAKLVGAYDWVGRYQRIYKRSKRRRELAQT